MRRKTTILQLRLDLIGAFILLTGLLGAVSVSLMATDDSSDAIRHRL